MYVCVVGGTLRPIMVAFRTFGEKSGTFFNFVKVISHMFSGTRVLALYNRIAGSLFIRTVLSRFSVMTPHLTFDYMRVI